MPAAHCRTKRRFSSDAGRLNQTSRKYRFGHASANTAAFTWKQKRLYKIFRNLQPGFPAGRFGRDAADQVRELGVSLVMYLSGSFVSQYDWKDIIGPKYKRPACTELA